MKALQVLAVLVMLLTLCHAIQTEYFVKPNESTPCPGLPCHTLSHYLESTTQYFASNTRISFLPGVHEIDKVSVLYIKNVSNFIITGYNVSSMHAAKVVCKRPAILAFFNIVNLVIKHLSIVYCGYPLEFEESVAVYLVDITSLKLLHISVENSTGYGLMGMNILGNSSVSHSRFIFNNYYTLSSTNCSYGLGSCQGGNMLLLYGTLPEPAVNITGSTSILSIDSCVFSDGVDVSGETLLSLSGGLAILYPKELLDQYIFYISLCNVISTRNVAKLGANFLFHGNIGTINITNSTSSMANYLLSPDEALHLTGFEFNYIEVDPSIQIPTTNKTLLHISDSKFYDNNGGGFNLHLVDLCSNINYHIIIKNCSFQRNMNAKGSGVTLVDTSALSRISGLEILMEDTSFTNNMMPEENYNLQFGVISVHKLRHLKIINCTFAMNKITALLAFDSTLYFGGHVIFSGNNGTLGGALLLQGGSTIHLMPNTHIQITNNHAKRGGGIYIEDENVGFTLPCFFQLMDLHPPYSDIDSVVTLENNTADEAGSAVYGGEIDNCYFQATSKWIIYNSNISAIVLKILDVPSLVSQVSEPLCSCFVQPFRRFCKCWI